MRMINVTLSCQFLPGVHKQCNTRDSHLHLAARRSTQLTEGKEKRLVKTPSSFFSCSSSSIVIVMVILMLKFMFNHMVIFTIIMFMIIILMIIILIIIMWVIIMLVIIILVIIIILMMIIFGLLADVRCEVNDC